MPTDFTLPELGENIAGGDVVRVLVAPGDSVKKDQPVLELETDKATIEVPSSVVGRRQGNPNQAGRAHQGWSGRADARQRRRGGEGHWEGPGGRGRAAASRAHAGTGRCRGTGAGARSQAEARPRSWTSAGGARSAPSQPQPDVEPQGPAAPAAPSVRRLARELGVDIKRVAGSGPAGRISLDDVQAYVRNAMAGGDPRERRRRRSPTSASGARSSASR